MRQDGRFSWSARSVAVANVSFEFSAVFHNALLPTIAPPQSRRGTFGAGAFARQCGGHDPSYLHAHCVFAPRKSALELHSGASVVGHQIRRRTSPNDFRDQSAALWLLVFSLPLFLLHARSRGHESQLGTAMITGVQSVITTMKSLSQYRNVGAYLLARLFFNDGMTAVLTFGGIYASSTFHWGPDPMLIYGIELSMFAVLGGFVGGWLDNHLGSKRAIFVSIGGTAICGARVTLTMAPDRIFWFIPYDIHAAPVWSAAVLQHLAGDHLPGDRQFHRGPDHGGLRQQPHNARAHRAAREDDGVLRALFAVRNVHDISRHRFRRAG